MSAKSSSCTLRAGTPTLYGLMFLFVASTHNPWVLFPSLADVRDASAASTCFVCRIRQLVCSTSRLSMEKIASASSGSTFAATRCSDINCIKHATTAP